MIARCPTYTVRTLALMLEVQKLVASRFGSFTGVMAPSVAAAEALASARRALTSGKRLTADLNIPALRSSRAIWALARTRSRAMRC